MDNSIWSAIREYHPKYLVTAHTYLAFVYLRGQYDPMNPSKGLFKGELLVRVRHYGYNAPILCSDLARIGILLHLHITKLSLSWTWWWWRRGGLFHKGLEDHMWYTNSLWCCRIVEDEVCGSLCHHIHHLSSKCLCSCITSIYWPAIASLCAIELHIMNVHDEEFDYNVLYHNIIDYFEWPLSPKKSAEVKDLLLWWNQWVIKCRVLQVFNFTLGKFLVIAMHPSTSPSVWRHSQLLLQECEWPNHLSMWC